MNDPELYLMSTLDSIIQTKLKADFECLENYYFEGSEYNRMNYKRLLVFYDNTLFEKAFTGISQLNRWINAYYWYSVYMSELIKQNIPIENYKQQRNKIVDQIDDNANPDFDWSIIGKIDHEFDLK